MFARALRVIELLRPHNMLAASFGVVAGYWVAGGRSVSGIDACALLAALATGAGNAINDLFDVAVDRVNKPFRPLPSGRLSNRVAWCVYAGVTVVVTLGAVLWLPRAVAVVVVAWEAALFAYAAVFKRVLIVGNVLVSAISASTFLVGALVASNVTVGAIPGAIAFAFVLCRELVKGGEDYIGDASSGVRTLAVAIGPARTARVAAACMLVVAAALPAPAVAHVYGPAYFLAMLLLVVPALFAGALAITRAPQPRTFARVSRALKLAMFAGIAAIVLGA